MHPTELTSDVIDQVRRAVVEGQWPQRALVRLGVDGSVAKRWLQTGEQRLMEGADPGVDVFARLWRVVDQAEADCEERWLRFAKDAAAEGRRMAAFQGWLVLLQQRFPDRWSRGAKVAAVGAPKSMEQMLAALGRGEDVVG